MVTPLANKLRGEGLSMKRRFRYLLVARPPRMTPSSSASACTVRLRRVRASASAESDDMPLPAFVNLSALKPGFLGDLGL